MDATAQAKRWVKWVFDGNHTDDEWLAGKEEIRNFFLEHREVAPIFKGSGAGEMLHMICSGIEYMRGIH